MRATKMASVIGVSALVLGALASAAGAQEKAQRRAPTIRVYSTNGAYTLATTSYVTPVIDVSENVYVFAVSMDIDGQIRVLQPDFPGISVKVLAHKQLKLPNFFTGFGQRSDGSGYYSSVGYSGYDYNGVDDARGTVMALASRVPFNLDRIEYDGDWNMSALRRLIEGRSPEMAAQALASYLGAEGEPIGRDYMRFAGGRNYYGNGYAFDNYYACDPFSGYAFAPTLAFNRNLAFNRIRFQRARGLQVRVIGYDLCGYPIVVVRQSSLAGGVGGGVRPPRNAGDTTVFPKSRFPLHGTGRHPPFESGAKAAPQGIFPLPQREGLPQMGDVTITAPKGRRSEPGQILQGYRPVGGTTAPPQGRVPIERVTTPRIEPSAATGSTPAREVRPESRPEPRSSAPPPSRSAHSAPCAAASRCQLAHVDLAGDSGGDESGATFLQQRHSTLGSGSQRFES